MVWFGLYIPDKWSVYKDDERTNNPAESWNRQFHDRFQTKAPSNIWEYISRLVLAPFILFFFLILYICCSGCLQHDEESARRDYDAAKDNQAIGRSRPIRWIKRDEDIAKVTEKLDNGQLALFPFLQEASSFYNPLPRNVIIISSTSKRKVIKI